jgi:transposase
MENIIPNYDPLAYFVTPSPLQNQYNAMRRFFHDKASAKEVAEEFGYTVSTVYTLARDFKIKLAAGTDPFFIETRLGRKKTDREGQLAQLIVELRKQFLSVPQIKSILDSQGYVFSERAISTLLHEKGFARIPRRDNAEIDEAFSRGKQKLLTAPISESFADEPALFSTQLAGLLCFLPLIKSLGIDELIQSVDYPQTKQITRLPSILSYLALKLSNIERYNADDVWCMDRGMGLFAGLNVLPKTAWLSGYSCAVTREMNVDLLKKLQSVWRETGLLSNTVNLDFTAIPYWGKEEPLENNWSGKYGRSLKSIQAVLAQDPDNGVILYGDTTLRHENQNEVVFEFLDFYRTGGKTAEPVCLVFDSRFTTYENLARLDKEGICFITIQRRSHSLEEKIKEIPESKWTDIQVAKEHSRARTVTIAENVIQLPKHDCKLRQIILRNTHRNKPAVIITNNLNAPVAEIVRSYARRWLVEKEISEQIHFFHLNRNNSGIVVKVDFDLTMTILAHNLYRVLAMELEGFAGCEAKTIFNKFVLNAGTVEITKDAIVVELKRKRSLPILLGALARFDQGEPYPWLKDKRLKFEAANTS